MKMPEKKPRLPIGIKVGYGAAEGANSITFTLFYTFAMFFLTDVAKLSPAFAGTIFAVGILWDAVTDPLVGIWSDGLKSKWGRRRPFILAIAIPFGVVTWLLFTDFNLSPALTKAYFFSLIILYFTVYTLLETPHLSLSAEMTQDYDERTSLVAWRTGWSQMGSVMAGSLPLMMVAYFEQAFNSRTMGWSLMAASFGLVCVPLILLTWRTTRGYELFPEDTHPGIKDIFQAPITNRPFRIFAIAYTLALMAMTIGGGVGMYYMTYLMGFSESQISIGLLILFGVSILWIPVIDFVASKLGKRTAWLIFIGIWTLVQGVFIQFVIQPGDTLLLYCIFFFAGSGLTSVYMLGWSMIPDCVEVDEYKTGQRREGLYFGFIAFIQKGGCALAMWILGMALSGVGYVPDVAQSERALMGIRTILGLGEASLLILSILFCYFMPITREKHQALCEAIQLKKEGKPCDEEGFADIIR